MRQLTRLVLAGATALAATAGLSSAAAGAGAPGVLAKAQLVNGVRALVDRQGIVHVAWTQQAGGSDLALRYVRGKAPAGKLASVALPLGQANAVVLYQSAAPASEVRMTGELVAGGPFALVSGDGGVSWSQLDTSPAAGVSDLQLLTRELVPSPLGLLAQKGLPDRVVRLHDDRLGYDVLVNPFAFPDGSQAQKPAASADGTVYGLGFSALPTTLDVLAGATKATLTVPGCSDLEQAAIAGGRSHAAVVVGGCGGAWVASVDASGALSKPFPLGPAAASAPTDGLVYAGGEPDGSLTVAWTDPSGDLGIARSSNDGASWKVQPGLLPVTDAAGTPVAGSLSAGSPSWFIWSNQVPGGSDVAVHALPLVAAYPLPTVSKRGIPQAQVARRGAVAVAAPKSISVATLRKTGTVPLRVAIGTAEKLTIQIDVSRPENGGTTLIAGFSKTLTVGPGKPATIAARLRSGSVTVGVGPGGGQTGGPALPAVKKGDTINIRIEGRNGTLQMTGKVS